MHILCLKIDLPTHAYAISNFTSSIYWKITLRKQYKSDDESYHK